MSDVLPWQVKESNVWPIRCIPYALARWYLVKNRRHTTDIIDMPNPTCYHFPSQKYSELEIETCMLGGSCES